MHCGLTLILNARKWQKSFCKGWWTCVTCIADTHRVDLCLEWVLILGVTVNDGENPEVGRAPGRPSTAKRTKEKRLSGVWAEGFSQLKLPQGWWLNSTFLTAVQSSLHNTATGNNATIALVMFASAAHHLVGWGVCFSLRNFSMNISLSVEFCHQATAAVTAWRKWCFCFDPDYKSTTALMTWGRSCVFHPFPFPPFPLSIFFSN